MDISVSSNFERYLFYLTGNDTSKLNSWMKRFESTGELVVSASELKRAQSEFLSCPSSREQIISTMRNTFDKDNYLVCPHTATAVVAVQQLIKKLPGGADATVVLATAHPAKFQEAIDLALIDGRKERNGGLKRPEELQVNTLSFFFHLSFIISIYNLYTPEAHMMIDRDIHMVEEGKASHQRG